LAAFGSKYVDPPFPADDVHTLAVWIEENIVRVAANLQLRDDLPGIGVVDKHHAGGAHPDKEPSAVFVERHRKILARLWHVPGRDHFALGTVDDRDVSGGGHVDKRAASTLFELKRFRWPESGMSPADSALSLWIMRSAPWP